MLVNRRDWLVSKLAKSDCSSVKLDYSLVMWDCSWAKLVSIWGRLVNTLPVYNLVTCHPGIEVRILAIVGRTDSLHQVTACRASLVTCRPLVTLESEQVSIRARNRTPAIEMGRKRHFLALPLNRA
jgi:hypothetical protein